jgi:hypothetical protein
MKVLCSGVLRPDLSDRPVEAKRIGGCDSRKPLTVETDECRKVIGCVNIARILPHQPGDRRRDGERKLHPPRSLPKRAATDMVETLRAAGAACSKNPRSARLQRAALGCWCRAAGGLSGAAPDAVLREMKGSRFPPPPACLCLSQARQSGSARRGGTAGGLSVCCALPARSKSHVASRPACDSSLAVPSPGPRCSTCAASGRSLHSEGKSKCSSWRSPCARDPGRTSPSFATGA